MFWTCVVQVEQMNKKVDLTRKITIVRVGHFSSKVPTKNATKTFGKVISTWKFRIKIQTLFTLFFPIKSLIFDYEINSFLFWLTETVNLNVITIKMCAKCFVQTKNCIRSWLLVLETIFSKQASMEQFLKFYITIFRYHMIFEIAMWGNVPRGTF